LPETNTGWIEASGVVVVRGGVTVLDDVLEEPDEPRCAAANCASKTMPTAAHVLKREEPRRIAPSFELAGQAAEFLDGDARDPTRRDATREMMADKRNRTPFGSACV
jgi:hypothetical protein